MRYKIQRYKQYAPRPLWQALRKIYSSWLDPCFQASFAQNGEDLVLDWYLGDSATGFYVDIGAHHPKRFSNTYRLYRRGWRGLNIDANPGSMAAFKRTRPRDINIEAAVAFSRQDLTYYVFRESGINTLDESLAMQHVAHGRPIIKKARIRAAPLCELLDKYVPANTAIDLLTVDVEGLDFEVLQSNDWTKYAPRYVLVECLDVLAMDTVAEIEITKYLRERNYFGVAKTVHTVLYRRMTE